jgi:diguanylate cyclase (GGDEF)-like protein/PAS domain S-box-containing protein
MRTSKLLTLVSIAASVAIVALVGFNIWKEREHDLDEAQQRLSDLSLMQAEQLERSLQAVDLVLNSTVEELGRSSNWESRSIHLHLKNYETALPQIRAVAVVAANGNIINDSALFPVTPIFVGDREHFAHLLEHPDDRVMYISAPFKSRRDHEWTVVLSRPITDKTGAFQGVVFARMQPQYFQENLQKILHHESCAVSVLRRDGTMLFRQPHDEKTMGKSFAQLSLFSTYLPAAEQGSFEKLAAVDGKLRLFSYSTLRNYPVVIAAHQEKKAILANWRNHAIRASAVVSIILLAGFFLTRRLILSLQQHERDIAAKLASEQQLRFMTENMLDVIWTWDSVKGITFVSPSVKHLLGHVPEELLGRQLEGLCAQCTLDKLVEKSAEARAMIEAGEPPPLIDLTFESQIPTKSAAPVWVENRLRLFFSADGSQSSIQGLSRDVTERKQAQQQLENLANFDALTGLPNRVLLADRMQLEMSRSKRHHHLLAVCFLDLDNFKPINDRHGHATGDHLIVQVANRLKQAIREEDTVARLGGDEFVMLITDLSQPLEVEPMLQRVLDDVAKPYVIDGIDMHISASIGVTLYPTDGDNPDILLRHADQAMYHAKQAGRNRFHKFDKHHNLQD